MQSRITSHISLVSAVPLLILAGGCATGVSDAGMSTRLDPGQTLTILVDGGEGRVLVKSEGPGQLVLRRQGGNDPEIAVGAPGDAYFTTRGRETWAMFNESGKQSTVDIRVTGSNHVEIRGPVEATKAK